MAERLSVLVPARDEEERIAATVAALREQFPQAEVIVADDGSRDGTAQAAEAAGARVLRLPRRGKGQALALAEQAAAPGPILLCDADLRGDLRPLLETGADLAVAAFAERVGGGFGLAKQATRALLRLATGRDLREPLSGQRALSHGARRRCFPPAAGFGCDAWITLDGLGAGLSVAEVELPLRHRPTRRDLGGFLHRGRQLRDVLLALGPVAVNHRGLRLPLVGWLTGALEPRVAAVSALGLADDLFGGAERGFAEHLRRRRTTGVLKLVGIPLVGLLATRRLSGGIVVGLAANALNQLDTKPGRALKAYALAAVPLRAPLLPAVILAPYDLREMAMLGDSGSNALGALLGLSSVGRFTGRSGWLAIGALAGLNLLGERRSLGELIERAPILRFIDGLGRSAS
ncbi:MAG TPA: glycosyltransferase [Gaiellaceae bacterium]|nr:glycosyltransferase [Gaiellaceae bacterium]